MRHIDFFTLDVEDHVQGPWEGGGGWLGSAAAGAWGPGGEMHVLQTMPEEAEGLTIDVILIENEKTSRVCVPSRQGRCTGGAKSLTPPNQNEIQAPSHAKQIICAGVLNGWATVGRAFA